VSGPEADQLISRIMGALQQARPDMMNAFNVECKNYGKCPSAETSSMAKQYYQFLLATYGRDLTNQLLPELVRLLPDANKRKTILEEVWPAEKYAKAY
jgi:hypothetical protein